MRNKFVKLLIITLVIAIITPGFSNITSSAAAPPPEAETYTEYFYSDESTYVYESLPSTNYNSGSMKYILNIGLDEFEGDYIAFVKFNNIDLPEDAVIEDAKIRLYCSDFGSHPNANIKMYSVDESWDEETINWNNKPDNLEFIYSRNVGADGPYDWDATDLVEHWLNYPISNYGVSFEEGIQLFSTPFYSDEVSYYGPRLEIRYQTTSGEEPEPPEEPPVDNTPCEMSYTVTPESPESGDEVTISVTATDDTAMQYISIFKGVSEVETCTAEGTVTSLDCSYSEVFTTPGNHSFSIFADDKGAEPPQGKTVYVDIAGSGNDPIVTISASFEESNAIPSKYCLLPMDGQTIDITATATDPDGIDMMTITFDGTPYDRFYDPPQTSVEETISIVNGDDFLEDCSPPCTFRYSVRAYDTEDRSARAEGEEIKLNAPWQWYWGLPFSNWGCDENHTWSWSMMESIFGDDIWWDKEHDWKKPHAEYLYKNKIKKGGRKGQCYGISALSIELASTSSSLNANMIQPSAVSIDDLERENWNNTWRYYYARQAGQYSFHRLLLKSAQYLLQPERTGSGLHPYIDDILDDIMDDLNEGKPGIISIFEGGKGHAVVPWRVVPNGSNMYNVYIYDPNHEYTSTHNSTDYTNFNSYPFIVFGEDGWARDGWWSYQWNSTSTWNENIYYTPYETVIGNPSSTNYIGSPPTTVGITDQRLPDPMQTLFYGSGDASFYIEDSEGRKTGYVNNTLVTNIPYSAPIFESDGESNVVDMFMLPNNVSLTIHTDSSINSENEIGSYELMLWHNSSFYNIKNVSCTKNTKDEIIFEPKSKNKDISDHSLKFKRGDISKLNLDNSVNYTINIAKEFYKSQNTVGREYIFSSSKNKKGSEIKLYVSDDYDDLVVETFDTPYNFTITTKSTESLEENPDIDYIPESKMSFSMDANEKNSFSPDDWNTTSSAGSVSTNNTQDQDNQDQNNEDKTETPGFGIVIVFIALFGLIWYKKRIHKL